MIYLQKTYVNDAGVFISGRLPAAVETDDEAKEGNLNEQFVAASILPLQLPTGQSIQLQFRFKIPGNTVAEAFANFPAALEQAREEAVKNFRAEQRKAALMNGVGRFNG